MIKLTNKEKRMQVFNIPAPAGIEDTFGKDIEMRLPTETPEGTRGIRILEKRIPGSISILVGQTSDPLPDWVASCPEVKAALDRGAIKLVKV